MKTLINSIVLLVAIVLLTSASPIENYPTKKSLEGSWELISFYSYENDQVIDTIFNSADYRQVKMYAGGKVMWSRKVPMDSIQWYGYGSYSNTDSTLTEVLEYGSASMMRILDTMRVFKFKLMIDTNSFSQITQDEFGNKIFSESYIRIK